jgi:hypothetical protein
LIKSFKNKERIDIRKYQRHISSIIYAIINIRLDTAFITIKLAQFISNPTTRYKTAAKHLLQYIRSTKNIKIRYGPKDLNLVRYSDTNYTSNKADRKSIIDHIFILAEGAVS